MYKGKYVLALPMKEVAEYYKQLTDIEPYNRTTEQKEDIQVCKERLLMFSIQTLELDGDTKPIVHAKWIKHENNKLGICMKVSWECSNCKTWLGCEHFVRRNYCPNCGAMMDEKE